MANYGFIDAQNVHKGIKSLGWKLDWGRFRVYLKEKYKVEVAYLFLRYLPTNQELYANLQKAGYILIFKPVIYDRDGKAKGNCDADLVLHSLLEVNRYDKAVVVTSDGDYYSLIRHLYQNNKLEMVLSPYIATCSKLLKHEAKEKINYMDMLQGKIGESEKAPHKDETL